MRTSIYEADPFSGNKGEHFLTLDTDYRFDKNDEIWLETNGNRMKVRVTWIYITVRDDGYMERELRVLKI